MRKVHIYAAPYLLCILIIDKTRTMALFRFLPYAFFAQRFFSEVVQGFFLPFLSLVCCCSERNKDVYEFIRPFKHGREFCYRHPDQYKLHSPKAAWRWCSRLFKALNQKVVDSVSCPSDETTMPRWRVPLQGCSNYVVTKLRRKTIPQM